MISLRSIVVAGFLAAASLAAAQTPTTSTGVEQPSKPPSLGTDTVHGCYKSAGELVLNSTIQFNTQGQCSIVCRDFKKAVGASTGGNLCYCGDKYPPKSTLVEDKECFVPCPGYGEHACGGYDTWTVYNTGLILAVQDAVAEVSSSATSVLTSATAVAPSIVTVSSSSEPTASSVGKSSGPNTVGIAVGVVVGLLVVCGIAGGLFFFMRSRRNKEIEEEYRRNAAVNAFISGAKPPGSSSGGTSISDSRLDPVMANRRLSTGSIADNEDYSRRILRVTN